MAFRFVSVQDDDRPLPISLMIAGTSGGGKTFTSLRLARGIAGGKPFGFIDTENRRALHYRRDFPEMMHLDFGPYDEAGKLVGYPPERWMQAIEAAEQAGLPATVIDSGSHAWEGLGGVLEMHARALERMTGGDASKADRKNMLAWAEVKPEYRRLINKIIQAKTHTIICVRAKPVPQKLGGGNLRGTKLRRPDLPFDIAMDGDLVFEMTASMLMTAERPGVPVPIKCADQFKHLLANGEVLGEAVGEALAEWSNGAGEAQRVKRVLDAAREAARQGGEALSAHWREASADDKRLIRTIQAELSEIRDRAEAEAAPGDPFAPAPQPSPEPGPEAPAPTWQVHAPSGDTYDAAAPDDAAAHVARMLDVYVGTGDHEAAHAEANRIAALLFQAGHKAAADRIVEAIHAARQRALAPEPAGLDV